MARRGADDRYAVGGCRDPAARSLCVIGVWPGRSPGHKQLLPKKKNVMRYSTKTQEQQQ
jgi:hypothetical protein